MAEETIEPRGEWRMDLRFAMLGNLLASCWSKKAPTVKQLMPKFGEPVERESAEDIRAKMTAWVGMLRGQRGNNR